MLFWFPFFTPNSHRGVPLSRFAWLLQSKSFLQISLSRSILVTLRYLLSNERDNGGVLFNRKSSDRYMVQVSGQEKGKGRRKSKLERRLAVEWLIIASNKEKERECLFVFVCCCCQVILATITLISLFRHKIIVSYCVVSWFASFGEIV